MRRRRRHRRFVTDAPRERTARVDVLLNGTLTSTHGKVMSTCTLVRDGDRAIVVDPGMADSARSILDPLEALGLTAEDITDVVLSHHHPDHTIYAGVFPNAAVHDHWAIYRGSAWEDSNAEGRELTASVSLIRVPGHTAEDIATVVGTADGVVVCSHLWWTESIPVEDPTAVDADRLHASRRRVLAFAELIVPGHGEPFRPTDATPR